MKNLLSILSLLFCCLLLIIGCSKEQSAKQYDMSITMGEKEFIVKNQEDLRQLVLDVAGEESELIGMVEFKTMKDDFTTFQAVSASYKKGEKISILAIPLEQTEQTTQRTIYQQAYLAKCSMTCDSDLQCGGCDMVIHEQCKRLTCKCNSQHGGCSSRIEFY